MLSESYVAANLEDTPGKRAKIIVRTLPWSHRAQQRAVVVFATPTRTVREREIPRPSAPDGARARHAKSGMRIHSCTAALLCPRPLPHNGKRMRLYLGLTYLAWAFIAWGAIAGTFFAVLIYRLLISHRPEHEDFMPQAELQRTLAHIRNVNRIVLALGIATSAAPLLITAARALGLL